MEGNAHKFFGVFAFSKMINSHPVALNINNKEVVMQGCEIQTLHGI